MNTYLYFHILYMYTYLVFSLFWISWTMLTVSHLSQKRIRLLSEVTPSDDIISEDAFEGRGLLQVLATGLIPAIICTVQPTHWYTMYISYMACNLGDTLASELGSLSPGRPRLILSNTVVWFPIFSVPILSALPLSCILSALSFSCTLT